MGTKNIKGKISIENNRKELFAKLQKNCKGNIIQKVIRFTNEDVPEYLKRLESIEEGSRKTRIIVRQDHHYFHESFKNGCLMLPTGEDTSWARTARGNNSEFIPVNFRTFINGLSRISEGLD